METISPESARRIAVRASGLTDPRPTGEIGARHLLRVMERLGLLQIDSVSVLARAHYLPLFSRLGPYRAGLLDEAAWGPKRSLFEYWAHEASLLPLAMHPLLRWRMERAAKGTGMYAELARFGRENRPAVEAALEAVRSRGPSSASDLGGAGGTAGWWGWSGSKRALECLFWEGRLTTASRRGFERLYDLPERVLPRAVVEAPTPSAPDALRQLLSVAARALGIATAGDLRDYHRLSPADAAPGIAALVEAGEVVPVRVPGWSQQAYLHRDAGQPRRVAGRALLAPFDPLVWHRPRAERLFGFRYRLEIYTPAGLRTHGYYVLPFLLGDRLVARVDLKADRSSKSLRVLSAHAEDGAPGNAAWELADELALMARWLGLGQVAVHPRGDMAPGLASAVASRHDRAS